MRRIIARTHQVVAWIVLIGLALQFYFIGMALFGAGPIGYHIGGGWLLFLIVPLLPVLALVGRLGRRRIGLSALLLVLVILQVTLPGLRAAAPVVAALHPVNAVVLLAVTTALVRSRAAETLSPAQPVEYAAAKR